MEPELIPQKYCHTHSALWFLYCVNWVLFAVLFQLVFTAYCKVILTAKSSFHSSRSSSPSCSKHLLPLHPLLSLYLWALPHTLYLEKYPFSPLFSLCTFSKYFLSCPYISFPPSKFILSQCLCYHHAVWAEEKANKKRVCLWETEEIIGQAKETAHVWRGYKSKWFSLHMSMQYLG